MSAKDLGSPEVLEKIDRLRELNVGSLIPLPQLVVVGDQSSGKSSVLESLTGFSFPRATTLCTRYATQITSRRDPVQGVKVSIIPRPDADDGLKARLLAFQREFTELNNQHLVQIFRDANVAMGICSGGDGASEAFSQDILKIEINGPNEVHLTVIDVPGIFRVATPGLTKETDPALVESMVKDYMNNPRTIILAVLPCNVDTATQEILKFASEADPNGSRTMGVLTKPDLVTEAAMQETVMGLLRGNLNELKLGYFVVKNRSADDSTSAPQKLKDIEADFFAQEPWTDAVGRCGVARLKERLRQLLMQISNQEFPHLKSDVQCRLRSERSNLEMMGPPRADEATQRMHLGKLATRFRTVVQAALSGNYASDEIFQGNPDLKLITKIMNLSESFSDTFRRRGHQHHFSPHWDDGGVDVFSHSTIRAAEFDHDRYDELKGIIRAEPYECPAPTKDTITTMIQDVYESNRGPELGTYGGTMLWSVFKQQSQKWLPLALSHVSQIIFVLHDFIFRLLGEICRGTQIRDQLWTRLLTGKLINAYQRAMDQTRSLVKLERNTMPRTLNHYFNSTLQTRRAERMSDALVRKHVQISNRAGKFVSVDDIINCATSKSNAQHACDDLLDSLEAYYMVAYKRFVDTLDQQVVSCLLLEKDESALQIFGPELVMSLDCEELERVAKEDMGSQERRQHLQRDIKRLEEALSVLQS